MSSTWKWVGRGWLLFVAGLWLACGVDGERAMGGECPADEVCDPTTPEGLNFAGESTSDLFLASTLPTATGGTQQFSVRNAGWTGGSPPPFDAVSAAPDVLEVTSSGGSSVSIRGLRPGSAGLRIINGDGELIDRTNLRVADVEEVELRSLGSLFGTSSEREWVFLRGSETTVVAALRSRSGGRLIDTSAQIAAAPGIEPRPLSWDAAQVQVPLEGDLLEVSIELGAGPRVGRAPIVDEVQELVRLELGAESLEPTPTIEVGEAILLCYEARHGDALVAGVTFEVEVEGALELVDDSSGTGSGETSGCFQLTGLEEGEGQVTVRAAGAEKIQPIRIEL